MNKQSAYKHEINYGMQTMEGGAEAHCERGILQSEKERKKWRKGIKKEKQKDRT
jgi:hypothetical protein